jgi:hypothetical protein
MHSGTKVNFNTLKASDGPARFPYTGCLVIFYLADVEGTEGFPGFSIVEFCKLLIGHSA